MENKSEKIHPSILSYEEFDDNENNIWIDEVSITYYQNGDCTESSDEIQYLKVSARNNGAARFLNIQTGENGWSVSDAAEDLKIIIKDFCKRAEMEDQSGEMVDASVLEADDFLS